MFWIVNRASGVYGQIYLDTRLPYKLFITVVESNHCTPRFVNSNILTSVFSAMFKLISLHAHGIEHTFCQVQECICTKVIVFVTVIHLNHRGIKNNVLVHADNGRYCPRSVFSKDLWICEKVFHKHGSRHSGEPPAECVIPQWHDEFKNIILGLAAIYCGLCNTSVRLNLDHLWQWFLCCCGLGNMVP